jgi:O-antigen/teichoic acid export membrane protein
MMNITLRADAIWTLVNTVISACSSLALVKLATLLIQPSQFGIASLILGLIALLNGLLGGPINQTFSRDLIASSNKSEKLSLVVDYRQLLTLGALIQIFALIAYLLFWHQGEANFAIFILASMIIFGQLYQDNKLIILESQKDYKAYALCSSIARVIPILVLVVIAQFYKIEAEIYLLTFLLGAWISAMLPVSSAPSPIAFICKRQFSFKKISDLIAKRKEYIMILSLSWIGGWLMSTSDRFVIEIFRSHSEVGIYVLNYGLWSMPILFIGSWLMLVSKTRVFEWFNQHNDYALLRYLVATLAISLSIGTLFAIVLFVLKGMIDDVLLTEDYIIGVWPFIWITVGHICYLATMGPMTVALAENQPRVLWKLSLFGGTINLLGNLIFVPTWGITGAAATTAMSFALVALVLNVRFCKVYFERVKKKAV